MAPESKEVQKREPSAPAEVERPAPVQTPAVDIYERKDALIVVADMPGVDEDSVDIHVEGQALTIEGRVRPEPIEGYELAYSEYTPLSYRRSFTLSDAIDGTKIEATIKQGVLRIVLPKAEAAKPKRISVNAG